MGRLLTVVKLLAVFTLIGLGWHLTSASGPEFTENDKAFYADANLLNFVRPGLVIDVIGHEVSADGTVRARVKLTDLRTAGLDREGIQTPGTVATSFILASIPSGQSQYTAFTTRVQTSALTGQSATQAGSDTGGTWQKIADGEYWYTFGRKLPANAARDAVYAIGAYGSRNLSEFDLPTNYDDDVYHFRLDGAAVRTGRDVVTTASCNNCHDPLALHGGSRRSVELCAMCHTPQTTDPDTGNTVDLPVMVHKIHMGGQLPSVVAGGKYRIIGNANSVHDYSTIQIPSDPRRCEVCHDGKAAQADNWLQPSRKACGACHDNVNFATGENHVDLPQLSDNQCANCHTPQGELDFDASIMGAHTIPERSRMLPGVKFEIVKVDDGSAGKRPTVTFSITDGKGAPVKPSEMTRLALVLGGPTSDYTTYVSEDARAAQGSGNTYYWTFQNPLPANAKGSYSVYIEGYKNTTLLGGTRQEVTVRDAGANKVAYFSVDGSALEPRRKVVDLAKCNSCHVNLSLHGGSRNTIEACVTCHNPGATDAARRPAAAKPDESIAFGRMIHRIHTGEENGGPYVIYGFGASVNDFSEVRYPGDRRNCNACHVNGSQNPPLSEKLEPVSNPRGLVNPLQPATASCTGCHLSRDALSHALVNTSQLGESCGACHGSNADFSVAKSHAR